MIWLAVAVLAVHNIILEYRLSKAVFVLKSLITLMFSEDEE